MTKNLIILAGGASSRMKNSEGSQLSKEAVQQANNRSKALILVNDRPMLDYVLYNAQKAGLEQIYIVISPKGDLFKSYYGELTQGNAFHGLTISYATQHIPEDRIKPLGTADAVYQTLTQYPELQDQEFIVCNCDNLYSSNAFKALRETSAANAFINYDREALQYPMERIARFALTKVNSQNYLEDIIEKPDKEQTETYRAEDGTFRVSMNIFKFNGSPFFPFLKNCPLHPVRKEKELPTALLNMIQGSEQSLLAIPFSEHVPDLTSKDDIFAMNAYLTTHFTKLDWN
jgi:glucose-1-phosphate adenylyltransferase